MRILNLVTLPIRTVALLSLWGMAYYYGYGKPQEEWRRESPEKGVVARYRRNGRPWRIFYDRNRNGKWDMWVDERAGQPYIVSIDDDEDGNPDREQDEWANTLLARQTAPLRAHKTLVELLHNSSQLVYMGLATVLCGLLEFMVRLLSELGSS